MLAAKSHERKPDPLMAPDLPSCRIETEHLVTAAQPREGDIARLRAMGFDAVVNISTPTARNYLPDEARQVLDAGMAYVHAPVDCSRLAPEQYAMVRGALQAFVGKKVLLHCAGNVKSSAMAHIYRVKELGEPSQPLRQELERNGWHERKWFDYFEAMGA